MSEEMNEVLERLEKIQQGVVELLEREGATMVGPAVDLDDAPDHLRGVAGVVHVQVSIDERGVRMHQVNVDDGRWFSYSIDPAGWAEVDAIVRRAFEMWASGEWDKKGSSEPA